MFNHCNYRYEANKKRRDEVQAFIDKFRYNAKRASLVQSRIKVWHSADFCPCAVSCLGSFCHVLMFMHGSTIQQELARMEELDAVEVDALFRFSLPQPEPIGIPVLQIKDVGFSYSGQKLDFLFSDVNIGIDMDTRMALLGVNGAGTALLPTQTVPPCSSSEIATCAHSTLLLYLYRFGSGKSTLLNIIMGKLEETAGVVVRNPKLRVGHFSQHHVELLEVSAEQQIADCFVQAAY